MRNRINVDTRLGEEIEGVHSSGASMSKTTRGGRSNVDTRLGEFP